MKIAIYPGTFDPITYGHIDILERAMKLFDRVIITIARNSSKNPLFSEQERLDMIAAIVKEYKNVEVDAFEGLLVTYAKQKKAVAIVRGLRAISDFEFELQMALMNRKLDDAVETVFFMPNEKYTYLNSSIVREIARLGGEVSDFVPPLVRLALEGKTQRSRS
jgi:pantetheine-phosphate adenylyltransferase